ncbi:MAG: glycosyltransferase [Arachnia sp.]
MPHETPIFSVVSALYNVAPYLRQFLDSFAEQTLAHDRFELVLVSDGSPDESEAIVEDFARTSDLRITLLRKENGGQASARNVGLEHATGEWVTFTDPDDWVNPTYLESVERALADPDLSRAQLYIAKMVRYLEAKDTYDLKHPLGYRFEADDKLVDLERLPKYFHMHAASAFFRRDFIEGAGLRFDARLPVFEDAAFTALYLLARDSELVAYLSGAEYYYRVRAAGDSSVQMSNLKLEKYTVVPRDGHRALVDHAQNTLGRVPTWLQFMLFYDISWYFRSEASDNKPSARLSADVCHQLHRDFAHTLAHISPEVVVQSLVPYLSPAIKQGILAHYYGGSPLPPMLRVVAVDRVRNIMKLSGFTSNPDPVVVVSRNGARNTPRMLSVSPITSYGETLTHQLTFWVPIMGSATISVDGVFHGLEPVSNRVPGDTSNGMVRALDQYNSAGTHPRVDPPANLAAKVVRRLQRGRVTEADLESLKKGSIPAALHARYSDCWVLMDRIGLANDNAEHLYRHILTTHPKTKAFFALAKESPDWDRLEREGFRLIEHGSPEFAIALSQAAALISSHMDQFITNPLPWGLRRYQNWKFVFLQHGVTQNDLSQWFNSKEIALITTASRTEHAHITAKDSPFTATSLDAQLTGMPRYDRLVPEPGRAATRVVVAPTWRRGLAEAVPGLSGIWRAREDVAESAYYRSFSALIGGLLRPGRLPEGCRVALLPHPSMDGLGERLLADHPGLELLSWTSQPFSELVASAKVWVTDYSSTAFDAAYAGVPVAYLQSDRDEVFGGGMHILRKGYFDYERDGFGPVSEDPDALATEVAELAAHGVSPLYRGRVEDTFLPNDGQNSERVFKAIRGLFRKQNAGRLLAPLSES